MFVRGPGLGTGSEIPALAAEYPDATVLGSGTATARRVLRFHQVRQKVMTD